MASLPALWHLGQQWLAHGHLALALSIIWSLYLVLVGAWILLQRRAPVATIGWLLSMAVLPVDLRALWQELPPVRRSDLWCPSLVQRSVG